MTLEIFDNYDALSLAAANEIIAQVRRKPASVLCLAAGDTPRVAYRMVCQTAIGAGVDFSRCTFVGLDEWLGIPPDNEGSCFFFLQTNLFAPLNIASSQIHLFNALSSDPLSECEKMDVTIKENGGIDLMLVGVGMNGHIGFNEPGVKESLYSHVVDLDETTQSVGQKYFSKATKLNKGITLGFKHLLETKKVIMMASAAKKADVIRMAIEGPITTKVPASIIRKHANASAMLDRDAAGMLTVG
jgi:glucosamine-6-phosphate isomerase